MFYKFLLILLAGFLLWRLIGYVRTRPDAFSKSQLSQSVFTLGILALFLIGFIAGLVYLVKLQ